MRPLLVCAIALGAVVGCTALTGVADLVAVGCGDCDGGNVDADVAPSESGAFDAADAEDALSTLTCPANFANCNENPVDGCEVDTRVSGKHCGGCNHPCDRGSVCAASQCVAAKSCKEILAGDPTAASGTYPVNPDGAKSVDVQCDMTTSGGGWTIVFMPATSGYFSTTIGYTAPKSVVTAATEVVLAYRNATAVVVGSTAVFALPTAWKQGPPFAYAGDDLTISVNVDGTVGTHQLRYGYGSFQTYCTDAWETTSTWGRICITDTAAPFFNAFAASGNDLCAVSSESYNGAGCSAALQFTIGVR